jgi:hypothetical protein
MSAPIKMKVRRPSKVMRMWDWSVPPTSAHREVLSIVPEGWIDEPRATRKLPILFICRLPWSWIVCPCPP